MPHPLSTVPMLLSAAALLVGLACGQKVLLSIDPARNRSATVQIGAWNQISSSIDVQQLLDSPLLTATSLEQYRINVRAPPQLL